MQSDGDDNRVSNGNSDVGRRRCCARRSRICPGTAIRELAAGAGVVVELDVSDAHPMHERQARAEALPGQRPVVGGEAHGAGAVLTGLTAGRVGEPVALVAGPAQLAVRWLRRNGMPLPSIRGNTRRAVSWL